MVLIPGGTFTLREPAHQVALPAFCIERTEVTIGAWRACVGAGRCAAASRTVDWPEITASDRTLFSRFCNANFSDRDAHPVNCVTQPQATAYCRWRYGGAARCPPKTSRSSPRAVAWSAPIRGATTRPIERAPTPAARSAFVTWHSSA